MIFACIVPLVVGMGATVFAQERVLRVGTNAEFAPFEFIGDDFQVAGFDIDLILAIGEVMGVEVEIISVDWDGIIPGLLNGDYDAIIAAMTITEERASAVDFSDPYFQAGQVIAVRADNDDIHRPEDLTGKRVAVKLGTTGHFAVESIPGVDVRVFNRTPDLFRAVKLGHADALVVDDMIVRAEVNANPGVFKIAGEPFTVESYGIAVRKSETELLEAINEALATLKTDGTYDAIYSKWFGAP